MPIPKIMSNEVSQALVGEIGRNYIYSTSSTINSSIAIGMSVSGTGVAPGAKVIWIERNSLNDFEIPYKKIIYLSIPNIGSVSGNIVFKNTPIFILNQFQGSFSPDYLRLIFLANGTFEESVAYNSVLPFKEWSPGLEIYVGINVKNGHRIYEITNTGGNALIPDGEIGPIFVTKTSTGTSGTNKIIVSDKNELYLNMKASGTGIAVGATITAISPSSNEITLSANNTGTINGEVSFNNSPINGITYTYKYNLSNLVPDLGNLNPPKSKGTEDQINSIDAGVVHTATGATDSFNITVDSATGIFSGMAVSGTGIGPGARVSSSYTTGITIPLTIKNSNTVSGEIAFNGAKINFSNSESVLYSAGDTITITGIASGTLTALNGDWLVTEATTSYIKFDTTVKGSATYSTNKPVIIGPYFDSSWIQDSTVYRALFNNDGSTEEPGLDAGNFDSSNNGIAVLRSSLQEGISNYKQIALFDSTEFTQDKYFYDYLIEPGMLYSYMLQSVNYDTISKKVIARGSSTPMSQRVNIIPDFTGSYLYGLDDVQLNFTYDGKLTNLKEVKKDAVIETIGSKYPFVVRNSDIGYKQFSFTAIITSISDPLRTFGGLTYAELMSGSDNININTLYEKFISEGSQQVLGNVAGNYVLKTSIKDKQYLDRNQNFLVEREFRKRVMSWLYNGKPKIFKSDTEGLFLVKITEVALEPLEELGRQLYRFSCTATEIDPITNETLIKYGFRGQSSDLFSYSQLGSKIVPWAPLTDYPAGVYIKYNKQYYLVVEAGASYSTPPTLTDPDTPITDIGTYVLNYAGNYLPGYFN
jgi:hypothetical protein